MKPFNLEAAKAGKKVVTRDGRDVRIVCFDMQNESFPLVAIIKQEGGHESHSSFTAQGRFHDDGEESDRDLFMVEEILYQCVAIDENGAIAYTTIWGENKESLEEALRYRLDKDTQNSLKFVFAELKV